MNTDWVLVKKIIVKLVNNWCKYYNSKHEYVKSDIYFWRVCMRYNLYSIIFIISKKINSKNTQNQFKKQKN